MTAPPSRSRPADRVTVAFFAGHSGVGHGERGNRRYLALVLRGRRRDPGLDGQVVTAAISLHCL